MRLVEGLVLKIQGKRVYLRWENIMRIKEEGEDTLSIFLRDGTSLFVEGTFFDDIISYMGDVYMCEPRRKK